MNFPLITDSTELRKLCKAWQQQSVIAVDTEASSFHHYIVRLCLIQVTTTTGTWLVDPLLIDDLSPFLEILSNPAIEIILHDADFDIRLFHREHKCRVAPIFDTRIAAQLIGEEHFSLQALLKKYIGVELDKKYQKADWLKRPLTEGMLAYAAMDTYHLLELRKILTDRLAHMGRTAWAKEEFEHLPDIPFLDEGPKDPSWLRIKWAKSLKGIQLTVLREVHAWRELEAERRDRAPFMVLPNHTLIDIAKNVPTSKEKLIAVETMSDRLSERYGSQILNAVRKAKALAKEDWPLIQKPKRFKRDEAYDERLKRLKDVRNSEAERLSLAQGVLCPNSILQRIARDRSSSMEMLQDIEGFRNWQRIAAGEALLGAV